VIPIGIAVAATTFVDSFSIGAQDGNPRGLAFNSDGTKMFVVGDVGNDINEYACTTGFDVSTCAFTDSFSVAGQDTLPRGLAFNSDGTKMFVAGVVGKDINEYACTTGFDVSTCAFTDSFSVAGQDSNPESLTFSTDGTKMFVLGATNDKVYEYTCTSFDASTCSFTDSFDVSAQDAGTESMAFSSAGTKMFILGSVDDDVYEYTLEVSFDFDASPPTTSTQSSGNSKGCRTDCKPPTLGVDNSGKRMVDNGFSYNGQTVQVERFHTDFQLITVQTGKLNTAELIIYENRGERKLTHVGLAFGLDSDQHFGDSSAIIEWDRNLSGEETVTQIDPNDVIDDASLRIESSKVQCMEGGKEDRCTLLKIFHKFRDTLEFNIVKTAVWDSLRNGWQNTFNHGIHIDGKSMNPPIQYMVSDNRNRVIITEIAKDVAIDIRGNIWMFDKSWKKEPVSLVNDEGVTMHLFDRNHSKFDTYKQGQELLASHVLEQICPKCSDESFAEIKNIFAYEMSEFLDRSTDTSLQSSIVNEKVKAEQKYHHLFEE